MTELLVNGKPILYGDCPVDYMADGLRLYFERGILPGSFMTAVLMNDFIAACHAADYTNRDALWEWGCWLYNNAPKGSWGSHDAVIAWSKARDTNPIPARLGLTP